MHVTKSITPSNRHIRVATNSNSDARSQTETQSMSMTSNAMAIRLRNSSGVHRIEEEDES